MRIEIHQYYSGGAPLAFDAAEVGKLLLESEEDYFSFVASGFSYKCLASANAEQIYNSIAGGAEIFVDVTDAETDYKFFQGAYDKFAMSYDAESETYSFSATDRVKLFAETAKETKASLWMGTNGITLGTLFGMPIMIGCSYFFEMPLVDVMESFFPSIICTFQPTALASASILVPYTSVVNDAYRNYSQLQFINDVAVYLNAIWVYNPTGTSAKTPLLSFVSRNGFGSDMEWRDDMIVGWKETFVQGYTEAIHRITVKRNTDDGYPMAPKNEYCTQDASRAVYYTTKAEIPDTTGKRLDLIIPRDGNESENNPRLFPPPVSANPSNNAWEDRVPVMLGDRKEIECKFNQIVKLRPATKIFLHGGNYTIRRVEHDIVEETTTITVQ